MSRSQSLSALVALVLVWGAVAEARVSHGYSGIFSLDTVTAVGDPGGPPQSAALTAIYPNPFNPRVAIEYELTAPATVELAVYDARGRLVRALVAGARSQGRHQETWDGCDGSGSAVPSGAYFCRLATAQGRQTRKLALVR